MNAHFKPSCIIPNSIGISCTWRSACPCAYSACSALLTSLRHCPLWWVAVSWLSTCLWCFQWCTLMLTLCNIFYYGLFRKWLNIGLTNKMFKIQHRQPNPLCYQPLVWHHKMSKCSTQQLLLCYKHVMCCITRGECCQAPLGTLSCVLSLYLLWSDVRGVSLN